MNVASFVPSPIQRLLGSLEEQPTVEALLRELRGLEILWGSGDIGTVKESEIIQLTAFRLSLALAAYGENSLQVAEILGDLGWRFSMWAEFEHGNKWSEAADAFEQALALLDMLGVNGQEHNRAKWTSGLDSARKKLERSHRS